MVKEKVQKIIEAWETLSQAGLVKGALRIVVENGEITVVSPTDEMEEWHNVLIERDNALRDNLIRLERRIEALENKINGGD